MVGACGFEFLWVVVGCGFPGFGVLVLDGVCLSRV